CPAAAEEAVTVSPGEHGRALLIKGGSRGSVILIPGGDGMMGIRPDGSFTSLRGNQLVRSRTGYAARGLAVLTVDRDADLGAAIAYMRKIAQPVALVGTSRGTERAARAIAVGAKPDALVLTAGFLDGIRQQIGSPGMLPRTLVVHHRQDQCRFTPPGAVESFRQWGGNKVAVAWLDGGPGGTPYCQARSFHGFLGLDGQVVNAVAQFVLKL
ncbi:MAG: alpha/beta hydrolase, partial [Xanthobacteraceae bacterium]